jgi:hypothetical protein
MIQVRITRDYLTAGGRKFRRGGTHQLADGDANVLIRRRIAEPVERTPTTARTPETGRVQTPSPRRKKTQSRKVSP